MKKSDHSFGVGHHRAVYLWAGPGTIRMNRLKFLGAPVNETVHLEAHSPTGVQRLAEEAAFNWAYLAYDWGFPPEVEQEDWDAFQKAVPIYHAAGLRVFGYIQTSNCVYAGSYRNKDWYALDSRGRPFYYYTGRYMTCWQHSGWREHLHSMVRGVVEAGADGVFFDNPWHASQPFLFGGTWLGPAGCYCTTCRESFRKATGLEIPTLISPSMGEASRCYLRWRADLVTQTLSEMAGYARSLKPDVVISSNNFDAVMRPSYLIYGIDLAGLAKVQDVMMIEDYGLPTWEKESVGRFRKAGRGLLINNALTLHTAVAVTGTTPVTTNPYDRGIGVDGVYSPRRFQQGIAEAAACGASMVVKGTEYVEKGEFTLLTAKDYAAQRLAIGHYQRWLEENAALYTNRKNLASVGLLYPGEALWQNWSQLAPRYFGTGLTLLTAGIPWRVVSDPEHLEDLQVLLTFGPLPSDLVPSPGLTVIDVRELADWGLSPPSLLARRPSLRRIAAFVVSEMYRANFRHRWARWLLDRAGLVHFFLQSPYFRLVPEANQQALLAVLGQGLWPYVEAKEPVLIEWWGQENMQQVHLVNYASHLQNVTVHFGQSVTGQVRSPDCPVWSFEAEQISLALDVYAAICYDQKGSKS